MILAVLDDLLFTSKIRATCAQLGVSVSFARSHEAALTRLRDPLPTLVVLDLNNPRTKPLAIVEAMQADPSLRAVPTLGFVSHVQTDLIDAARKAGVTHTVARSAFVEHLPELLMRGPSAS
jgi:PleD family two-component response regulator